MNVTRAAVQHKQDQKAHDRHHPYRSDHRSKGEKYGSWNGSRFGNAELDKKIEALASETDLDKRNKMIGEIWAVVQEEILYPPIHHQVLNWGMKDEK